MDIFIMRLKQAAAARGRSRTSHYGDVAAGLCTRPVKVGARAVGWPAGEIEALNAARIAGRTDEQVRALVQRLEAARAGVMPE